MDVVSASARDGLHWYRNEGQGTLSEPIVISGSVRSSTFGTSSVRGVVAADLDGDGVPDIVSGGLQSGQTFWVPGFMLFCSGDLSEPCP